MRGALLLTMLTVAGCDRVGYEVAVVPTAEAGADGPGQGQLDAASAETASSSDGSVEPPEGDGATDTAQPPAADGATDTAQLPAADAAIAPDTGAPEPDAAPAASCSSLGAETIDCWNFDDPATTLPTSSTATATRDTTRYRSGGASMRVVTGGGTEVKQVFVERQLSPPRATGSLFLRAFVYLPTGARIEDWAVPLEIKTNSREKVSLDLGERSYSLNAGSAGIRTSTTAFPRDRWVCVELQANIGPAGNTRLIVDGAPVFEISGNFAWMFDAARAGVIAASRNTSLEIGTDEVVFATAPIGCN